VFEQSVESFCCLPILLSRSVENNPIKKRICVRRGTWVGIRPQLHTRRPKSAFLKMLS
jgi:hypothetical protein